MAKSKKVLIQSSVIFAFINRAHPKHEEASAFFRFFGQENYTVYIDILNLNETYSRLYNNISPSLAKDLLRIIPVSNINVIFPEETDLKTTVKTLASQQSTDLTFSKALSSVLASRRDIPQICTFDYLHQLFGLQLFYLPL